MSSKKEHRKRRLYVLDTNVLMHDPTSLFRFEEHDIYLPTVVLEELDNAKKGMSEVARNVRQVSRFLADLIGDSGAEEIQQGIPLVHPHGLRLGGDGNMGRLFFQHRPYPPHPELQNGHIQKADNKILDVTLTLKEEHAERRVVLVSKDINLRIKATVLGLDAEDYFNDRALDDLSLLYTGARKLEKDFWESQGDVDSWAEGGSTFYKVPNAEGWHPNECLYLPGDNALEAIVRSVDEDGAVIELVMDYRNANHSVWGISARNREQNFALNLLMDPEIDFVTLLGTAGTGKTLLSLAAGLSQTLDEKQYTEIIMTRATVPVGEDIGFLPGTEEEKMSPWMGALDDNLEVLHHNDEGGEWGRAATNDLLSSRIKVRSLNFMRGRTFLNRYVIIDEAQNLTPKQMKTLITRAGPGTKMICLGNVEQIDTPYLTETSSGLTYVIDRFRHWRHAGHITLKRGERSRLADYASEAL